MVQSELPSIIIARDIKLLPNRHAYMASFSIIILQQYATNGSLEAK